MYKYLMFDLDGTLVESGDGIVASAKHALGKMGRDMLPENEFMKFIGPPLFDSFTDLCGMNYETLGGIALIISNFLGGWIGEHSLLLAFNLTIIPIAISMVCHLIYKDAKISREVADEKLKSPSSSGYRMP